MRCIDADALEEKLNEHFRKLEEWLNNSTSEVNRERAWQAMMTTNMNILEVKNAPTLEMDCCKEKE